MLKIEPLFPVGALISCATESSLYSIPIADVRRWIDQFRLIILRGVESPEDVEMRSFCEKLGPILEWEFGAVNELKVKEDTKNYLYTNREVPFHWDGAFVGKVPHYIFFHCRVAPDVECGGETTFCDTVKLLQSIPAEELEKWKHVSITYRTEKIVHYGGEFTSPLLANHPTMNQQVLRYAEPVDDLNPVTLQLHGIDTEQQEAFIDRMRELLYCPSCCYAHSWQTEDIVIADNHALLHGRLPFLAATTRHLRRINVL